MVQHRCDGAEQEGFLVDGPDELVRDRGCVLEEVCLVITEFASSTLTRPNLKLYVMPVLSCSLSSLLGPGHEDRPWRSISF